VRPEADDSILCLSCRLLCRAPSAHTDASLACPRCAAALQRRRPNASARSWALLAAAAILYVPANRQPVLHLEILGRSEADTILAGVVELVASGMWEVGAIVFLASIVVPLVKILGLAALLVSLGLRRRQRPRQRSLLYRSIEGIGRWSMVDMFMLSILVALVQLGSVATIESCTFEKPRSSRNTLIIRRSRSLVMLIGPIARSKRPATSASSAWLAFGSSDSS